MNSHPLDLLFCSRLSGMKDATGETPEKCVPSSSSVQSSSSRSELIPGIFSACIFHRRGFAPRWTARKRQQTDTHLPPTSPYGPRPPLPLSHCHSVFFNGSHGRSPSLSSQLAICEGARSPINLRPQPLARTLLGVFLSRKSPGGVPLSDKGWRCVGVVVFIWNKWPLDNFPIEECLSYGLEVVFFC